MQVVVVKKRENIRINSSEVPATFMVEDHRRMKGSFGIGEWNNLNEGSSQERKNGREIRRIQKKRHLILELISITGVWN